jgi:hypothetical protein
MLQLAQHGGVDETTPAGLMSTPMGHRMAESVLRFLEAMGDPLQAAVLGPALVREIYFHVLAGAQGGAMRAALAMQGRFGKIARAIRRIHQSYATGLAVEELAKESGMSVPSFHSHFRSVTRTSPVQCTGRILAPAARTAGLCLRSDDRRTGGAACPRRPRKGTAQPRPRNGADGEAAAELCSAGPGAHRAPVDRPGHLEAAELAGWPAAHGCACTAGGAALSAGASCFPDSLRRTR